MITKDNISVGDIVELNCPILLGNLRHNPKTIIGKVTAVFDALLPNGEEGNLQIDITYGLSNWIRYKPLKDGGTIRVLESEKQND
jgi:hypothetical protein